MQDPYSLHERTALVTGGGEGIGFGIAKQFIRLGANVVITGRTQSNLEKARDELGARCSIYVNDVTDKSSHQAMVDFVETETGPIDILVNNAGKHMKKPALEVSDEDFQSIIDVNLNSVFALTRTVLPGMIDRQHGSVIFISSMAALYGLSQVVGYSSSKTALLGLARTLASEYSGNGIRFNAIAPGFIESKMFLNAVSNDPERKAKILSRTPANKFGKPDDIGMAAAFLASDASEFITGVCLPVDGGNAIGF